MLEVNMDRRFLLVLIGVFAVIGVVSKCVVSISLKSLTRAAGNMGKSSFLVDSGEIIWTMR